MFIALLFSGSNQGGCSHKVLYVVISLGLNYLAMSAPYGF
jgi:hypothetical protein